MGDTRAMGSGEATEDVVAVKCRLGLLSCVSTVENEPMSNAAKATTGMRKLTIGCGRVRAIVEADTTSRSAKLS